MYNNLSQWQNRKDNKIRIIGKALERLNVDIAKLDRLERTEGLTEAQN